MFAVGLKGKPKGKPPFKAAPIRDTRRSLIILYINK